MHTETECVTWQQVVIEVEDGDADGLVGGVRGGGGGQLVRHHAAPPGGGPRRRGQSPLGLGLQA